MSGEENLWSFGYGSNMDVVALQAKKNVRVIDHTPAILYNFKLTFSIKGMTYAEPAYASLKRKDGEEVHGVAFLMGPESLAELDRTEAAYNKESITMISYDGRSLDGFVYMPKVEREEEYLPSKRYLGVLCKGAKQAGLKTDYVDKLEARSTYNSADHPEVLEVRAKRKEIITNGNLNDITCKELAEHKDNESWISVLGMVIRQNSNVSSHKGRDVTSRMLMHFHGIPMDANDDSGLPPYPLIYNLTPDEQEYIERWLDHYQLGPFDNQLKNVEIMGLLKEFQDQQQMGSTEFKLPNKPE